MNSPIVDTSQLDDESGLIPEVDLWEKNCEGIPKANDFKYGVNFMNQLINISKLDYFLQSTIDDSNPNDSGAENKSTKSGITKAKSKVRSGSGAHLIKNKKGRFKGTKNADLIDAESEASSSHYQRREVNSKAKKRIGSTSPFPQQNLRNKKKNQILREEQKSTDVDEDSKLWGLTGKGIDKK